MKTFILGDVHGEIEKLEDVLIKSGINYKEDTLIFLGDVVDRGSAPFECIDLLLTFKNLIPIAGNHDVNFQNWVRTDEDEFQNNHGSVVTKFIWNVMEDADRYHYMDNYFNLMRKYHIIGDSLFVHGGLKLTVPLEEQSLDTLCWDRSLWEKAINRRNPVDTLEQFKTIYIGHTPTIIYNKTEPMFRSNVWNLDTGCGKGGLLTIMDLETNKFWQA